MLDFSIPSSTPIAITNIVAAKNNINHIIGSVGDDISCSNNVCPSAFAPATTLAGNVI